MKTYIHSRENINTLINENKEAFDFAKKINLELYQITQQKHYLRKLLSLHESAIYNRIRARLNLKTDIAFLELPRKVQEQEGLLKRNLRDSKESITDFMAASASWNQFLDSLELLYPTYYKMRYASLLQPLDNLQTVIPKATTVIRYLFVGGKLYAYVADSVQENLIPLDFTENENIIVVDNFQTTLNKLSEANQRLYQKLWLPLESFIEYEKVIIYPDAQLFNLNFELLSPQKIANYKELSTNSLLAKHRISYNYSLLLLDKRNKTLDFEDDFVAFAPEFDEQMKINYQLAISDSLYLDKTYLTLLPQPFSLDLVKKFTKKFNGDSFLNEKASKQLFTQTAKEHKIIHLGTHAESNNVSPELSRLVFAKNVSDSVNINDNYLYTYEIYNQNLSSNLAILTACETGKPTHQPGEGMISLAHAFNYAGSESILTSLWQIDEQSSGRILEYFYEYLSAGKAKDEALRLAKLEYLKKAEGRTLHPEYWAGLILMGDTTPIAISENSSFWVWGMAIMFLVVIGLSWRYFRQR